MDLKTAMVLAKRFLTSTVVVILVLGSSMVWVWGKYEKVVEQRTQLTADWQAFNKEKLASEIVLSERKAELDKREFIVQQREKDYQERLASFQQRVAEYSVASTKLKQEQAAVSKAQRTKDAEENIQRLMSEFSALGVDLNSQPCDDAEEARTRYNAATARFSEIRSLIEAHGLKGRYNAFLNDNRRWLIRPCSSSIRPRNVSLSTDKASR